MTGCLPAVGVEKLLKHDLFENMFAMFHNKTMINRPYAPFWSAYVFHQLVGTADVMKTTVEGAAAATFHAYTFTHVRAAPMNGAALLLVNLDRTLQASVPLPPTLGKSCTSVAE